jgi:alpha-L-rhamnosidase
VAGWLTQGLAGLSPAAPGWRRIRIAPLITDHLTHAESTVDTPYGTARSAWRRDADDITLEITVPPGATAEVDFPPSVYGSQGRKHVASGRHTFTWGRAPLDRQELTPPRA